MISLDRVKASQVLRAGKAEEIRFDGGVVRLAAKKFNRPIEIVPTKSGKRDWPG